MHDALLAYEIHDGMVQHITGAHMRLQTLLETSDTLPEHVRREIEVSLDLIRNSIAEARHLIRGLRPPVLDELGMTAALEHMIDELPPDGPTIEFKPDGQFEHLDHLLENAVLRIIQEAVTNARRHSGSDRIVVHMTRTDEAIELEVRDWGVGFDPRSVAAERYGLEGIRERARLLGGRTMIKRSPGKGTRVCVELPITHKPGKEADANNGSNE